MERETRLSTQACGSTSHKVASEAVAQYAYDHHNMHTIITQNTYIDTVEEPTLTSTSSNWYKGWTVGAGGEHFVYDNLAIKAEFRYTDDDNQVDSVYSSTYKVNFQPNKSVRIGVAYHF